MKRRKNGSGTLYRRDEEISTDFCDGWGLRIVEEEVEA